MPEAKELLTDELEGLLMAIAESARDVIRIQERLRVFSKKRVAKAAGWDAGECEKVLRYLRAAEKKLARAMCGVVRPVSEAKGGK